MQERQFDGIGDGFDLRPQATNVVVANVGGRLRASGVRPRGEEASRVRPRKTHRPGTASPERSTRVFESVRYRHDALLVGAPADHTTVCAKYFDDRNNRPGLLRTPSHNHVHGFVEYDLGALVQILIKIGDGVQPAFFDRR